MKKLKKRYIVLAVLVIVILGAMFSSGEEEQSPVKQDEPVVQEDVKTYGIGDEIKADDLVLKVTGVETSKSIGNDFSSVEAQNSFLIVSVEVRNEGNEAADISSSFFTLSASGKTYESTSDAILYQDDPIVYEEINPDASLKGTVVFDVKETLAKEKDLKLVFETAYFGGETIEIQLAQ